MVRKDLSAEEKRRREDGAVKRQDRIGVGGLSENVSTTKILSVSSCMILGLFLGAATVTDKAYQIWICFVVSSAVCTRQPDLER